MQTQQIVTIVIAVLVLFLGFGLVVWPFFQRAGIPALLFWWIWLGLWVALFECELFGNRQLLTEVDQPAGPWLELWREYSVNADRRYVSNAQNRVHWIEMNNAYVSFALFALLLLLVVPGPTLSQAARKNIIGLLIILLAFQSINTIAYFGTWFDPANEGLPMTPKCAFYLFLSLLWVIVPLLAIAYLVRRC